MKFTYKIARLREEFSKTRGEIKEEQNEWVN